MDDWWSWLLLVASIPGVLLLTIAVMGGWISGRKPPPHE